MVYTKCTLKMELKKSKMKIHILHYHLHPGGVTRVIESQIESLRNQFPETDLQLITGYCPNKDKFKEQGVNVIENPKLNYLFEEDAEDIDINDLFQSLLGFLYYHIGKEDILHAHNLNLGKNPALTYAVSYLAQRGLKVINHCHDFAEDRPNNWKFLKDIIEVHFNAPLKTVLYPSLENYRFAVLNSYDLKRISSYSLPEEQIHYLPNPIHQVAVSTIEERKEAKQELCNKLQLDSEKHIITYPVRVIRRKNIGEMILLSVLFGDQYQWLVTLPPKNPQEVRDYEKWQNFAAKYNLPIQFEVGTKVEFSTLLKGSDFCITTSVREGFGMAFMEPWMYGTPVIGRKLPYVVDDFVSLGFQFPNLYDGILVEDRSEEKDFKDIIAEEQMDLIKQIIKGDVDKTEIFQRNPHLDHLMDIHGKEVVEANIKRVKQHYSLEQYGKKLGSIYRQLSEFPGTDAGAANKSAT